MTRINTNIASLTALRNLTKANMSLNRSLERLSSGTRINRGGDDPAGLVISERLRGQLAALKQATENTQRASNMVTTAEGALGDVNSLLLSMKDLALQASNTGAISAEEIDANQAQIDSAVDSINRIAQTTKFSSKKLLDGSLDYALSTNTPLSALKNLQIFGVEFGGTSTKTVTVKMTVSAQLAFTSKSTKGTSAGSAITLQITGNKGTEVITIGASTGNSGIKAAINAVKDSTGVSAITSTTISGGIFFYSTEFGKDQFVSIKDLDTDGNNTRYNTTMTAGGYDKGQDATIMISGIKATTRGLKADVNTTGLKMHVDMVRQQALNVTKTFTITGGGASYQLGTTATPGERFNLGVQQMNSYNLGENSVGFLNQIVTGGTQDLRTSPSTTAKIIDAAIDDVTAMRARVGAIDKNVFQTNLNELGISIENLSDAESRIRDTDFAAETANFTRAQILVQAGTAILAQANLTPQSVLALLGR